MTYFGYGHVDGTVPKLDPDFMIDRVHLDVIKSLISIADGGEPTNIGLSGPVGSGKTTLARQIGAIRHAPTFSLGRSAYEVGYSVSAGAVYDAPPYRPSPLTEAIETEDSVVVLDDLEFEAEGATRLLPILDPTRRQLAVPRLGRTVRVARGVIIVGTWNPKYNPRLTAASEMFIDRFRAGGIFQLQSLTDVSHSVA